MKYFHYVKKILMIICSLFLFINYSLADTSIEKREFVLYAKLPLVPKISVLNIATTLIENNKNEFDLNFKVKTLDLIKYFNEIDGNGSVKGFKNQNNYYPEGVSETMDGLEEKDININLRDSWVHIANGKGSWHGNHRHPMTSWGGIYYLKIDGVNENNGGKNTISQPVDNQYIDFGNFFEHQYAVWSPPMDNGGCLFFPAHLSHNAQPYFGEEDRIVIATNIIVGKNV